MDILTVLRKQAVCLDAVEEAGCSTVIEKLWWFDRFEPEINSDGMPLIGTNEQAVVGYDEPLLVIGGDDFMQHAEIKRNIRFCDQLFNTGPSFGVKIEVDGIRLMTQDIAEELTNRGGRRSHWLLLFVRWLRHLNSHKGVRRNRQRHQNKVSDYIFLVTRMLCRGGRLNTMLLPAELALGCILIKQQGQLLTSIPNEDFYEGAIWRAVY